MAPAARWRPRASRDSDGPTGGGSARQLRGRSASRGACYRAFCSGSGQGRLVLAPLCRQVGATNLLLQQTTWAQQCPDFGNAFEVKRRVGLAVISEQLGFSIGRGHQQGVMPWMDREAEVGQEGQTETEDHQAAATL